MPRINRLVLLDTHSLRLLITMRPVVFTLANVAGPNPSTLILFDFRETMDTSSWQIARKTKKIKVGEGWRTTFFIAFCLKSLTPSVIYRVHPFIFLTIKSRILKFYISCDCLLFRISSNDHREFPNLRATFSTRRFSFTRWRVASFGRRKTRNAGSTTT